MIANKIKEVTKEAHQQLEKIVVLKIKNIQSDAEYADLLKHFYVYFTAVEKAIEPYILEVLPDYGSRRNASYIREDIKELGGDVSLLPPATAPEINNTAEAMGSLYVLEGSTMGGPYIIQMLQKRGINKGFSFFSGYGENAMDMWKKFIETLQETADTDEKEEAAMQKASETFARFREVFDLRLAAE